MIMKCVKAMGDYTVGDEVTQGQLVAEGHPQCIIDYCFTAKPESKPKVVKLAIIESNGRLGCWVNGQDYGLVMKEDPAPISHKRWLPLETIPGLASFSHWEDKAYHFSDVAVQANGRWLTDEFRPAGHAAFAVFAAKE